MRLGCGVAGVALALVLAACDGPATAPPSPADSPSATMPTPSASPTAPGTPSPTIAAPSPDTVAGLVTDALALGYESTLPPGTDVPPEVAAQVDAATTSDGTAREFVMGEVALAFSPESSFRGSVQGEVVGDVDADSSSATAMVCIAVSVEPTATGDDAVDIGRSDRWSSHDVELSAVDGAWVLDDIDQAMADDGPVACVPPTLAADLEATWERYAQAEVAFRSDPGSADAATAFSQFLVGSVEAGQGQTVWDWDVSVYDGFTVLSATPDTASTRWCMDMSQDPDAAFVFPDGSTTDAIDQAWTGEWVLVEDQWRLDTFRQALGPRDDYPVELEEAWAQCAA